MGTYEIYFDNERVVNIYNEDTQEWVWDERYLHRGRPTYMFKGEVSAKKVGQVIDFARREVTALLGGSLRDVDAMSDYEIESQGVERVARAAHGGGDLMTGVTLDESLAKLLARLEHLRGN